jgi:hypothetical protein
MNQLRFQTYTSVRLPSGTFLFFPALEDRVAGDKSGWATIVAYDSPPHLPATLLGNTLHLALEESEFRSLELNLAARDEAREALVVEYELSSEGELRQLRLQCDEVVVSSKSDIRALRMNPDGAATAEIPRAKGA